MKELKTFAWDTLVNFDPTGEGMTIQGHKVKFNRKYGVYVALT